LIDGGELVTVYLRPRDTPPGEGSISFDEWLKSGQPTFVDGHVNFTLLPSALPLTDNPELTASRIDAMHELLKRLRGLAIALVFLSALSVALQCARG
jgi:hypothetical protein